LSADGQEITSGAIPINGKAGASIATTVTVSQEIDLQALPNGPFVIELTAQDTAENSSTESMPLSRIRRDRISILSMPLG